MSERKRAGTIIACVVVVVVVMVMTTSCVPSTYTLDVSVNPSGAGSVSPSGGEYQSGRQVELKASPATDYAFGYWSGNASGTAPTITITMDSNKTLTANFVDFTDPGIGAAIGQIIFPDDTPASGSGAYIFKSGESHGLAADHVDTNGYYIFDDLPVGSYKIYVACPYKWAAIFTPPPEATIDVREHEITIVSTVTVLKPIEIALEDPKEATNPDYPGSKYVIDGHSPEFTWDDVQNAAYYVVTISSDDPDDGDYEEYQQVVDTMIVWPTSLSSLPYQEFRIDVDAYMEDRTRLGSGYKEFAVDNPPEGWVYE